jgi:hypothetical protein
MMDKKYDIYITFPADVIKVESKLASLITTTIDNIRISLSRIMKRDIIIAAKGIDFNNTDYKIFLLQSANVVFFVSPQAEADGEYSSELKEICDFYKLGNDNLSVGDSHLFKISIEPPKGLLNPICLNELISYNFYEKNIYNRKIKSLDFSSTDKSAILYSKLLDLAYDISVSLKNIASSGTSYDKENQCIYLGLTSFDQIQSREDIRRELQHYGYIVLPKISMPEQGEEFEKSLITCLQQADYVIELMGSQYGEILKGSKYSLPDLQNRVIREYQQKNSGTKIKRFIWIPLNNKISDQRQALYLKRLRRDDASESTEIIESPLETFKTIVASKLQDTNHTQRVHFDNISSIYLLMEEEQSKNSEELYSTLSLSGLKVQVLDYSEQVGIYARHLQALRDSDAVVIYQNSSNSAWLSSKIRDIIKAPGLGKLSSFKKIVLVSRIIPDKQLIKMIKSKVEILDINQADTESILNKLISE